MILTVQQLCHYLGTHGVARASELASALGISQPTLSRALASLGPQRLIRIGRARATRYALRTPMSGGECPVYLIDESGKALHLGVLYRLSRGEWYFQQDEPWVSLRGEEFRDGLYPDLPWFLQDMRPRGFLGRCFARTHAGALQAPQNPSNWSSDQVLESLRRFGADMPGALIVGQEMLERFHEAIRSGNDIIDRADIPSRYVHFAEQSLAGEWPGSSAAGEQPKFTARLRRANGLLQQVLVKFSGDVKLPEARRWSDLLFAEHCASTVLSAQGLSCAQTNIVQSEGRTFLESERFDRCGLSGRRAVVSLEALDAAYTGVNDLPWNRAANILRESGWIDAQDARRLSLFWWFGVLIGNSDMHYGNLSFFLDPRPPLRLAPLYDMVPMTYRPGLEGALPAHTLRFVPPPPEEKETWSEAAPLALRFWEMVASDQGVSAEFRAIAAGNRTALQSMMFE
jgi:hypothetical protein